MHTIPTASESVALVAGALLCLGGLFTTALAVTSLLALLGARRANPGTNVDPKPLPGDYLLQTIRFNRASKG